MHTMTFPLGQSLGCAARLLVARAEELSDVVQGTFNGIILTAHPEMDPDEVIAHYIVEAEARQKAWRETPEGKELARDPAEWKAAFRRSVRTYH